MSPFARVREDVEIPARHGRAFAVAAGEVVQVIDVKGQQAVDFFAFARDDPREFLSAEHTRPTILRLFPHVGESFYTNRRRAIVTLVEDHSPGIHDMLFAACDPTRYTTLGCGGWHASCQENLLTEMAALGVTGIEVPQPVNLFTNFPVGPDGTLSVAAPNDAPGDYVLLRMELDGYVCVSACPQDMNATNAGAPTEIRIRIGTL